MKNFYLKLLALILILGVNPCLAAVTAKDYTDVVKNTKKMCKLSNKGKIQELAEYFSDGYKSHDGFNKEQMMKIAETANNLYPNTKSKEKIEKVEVQGDYIKVYITETSKTRANVKGKDAKYTPNDKMKGKMVSKSNYAMVFKKENNLWKVVCDEIYSETTKIMYGEAIKTDFSMEAPKEITAGSEFTVKTTVKAPSNRFVVGSIGHDKVVFPPEKYFDPYRAIDEFGILERIMIANKEGKNEYINSTYAFIAPITRNNKREAVITGMGIFIQRANIGENL